MSYSYLLVRLPDDIALGPVIDLDALIQALPSVEHLQAELFSLYPSIKWSEHEGTLWGTLPNCAAEFWFSKNGDGNGVGYNGPSTGISAICKRLNMHCWDPQINEIWTPSAERISFVPGKR